LRGRSLGFATVAEQLKIVAFAAHSPLGGSKFVGQGLSSVMSVLELAVGIVDDRTHATAPSAVCDDPDLLRRTGSMRLEGGNIHARGPEM
jgi:hypothetical protein